MAYADSDPAAPYTAGSRALTSLDRDGGLAALPDYSGGCGEPGAVEPR